MKVFERFGDYFFFLLPGPLKKLKQSANHWHTLAQTLGGLFDEAKRDLSWAREQSIIGLCQDELLELHGRDREMPRLRGETFPAYRRRLLLKEAISRQAGTNEGIKTAVAALGFDNSTIEPLYLTDRTRWAEFMVWLRCSSKDTVSLNDIQVIDEEVMKVKQASSLPNYGLEFARGIELTQSVAIGSWMFPLCGTFRCGTYPPRSEPL